MILSNDALVVLATIYKLIYYFTFIFILFIFKMFEKNCQYNTYGDRCQYCKPGYTGDARRGTKFDCRPAMPQIYSGQYQQYIPESQPLYQQYIPESQPLYQQYIPESQPLYQHYNQQMNRRSTISPLRINKPGNQQYLPKSYPTFVQSKEMDHF